jgi:hypothetical protein
MPRLASPDDEDPKRAKIFDDFDSVRRYATDVAYSYFLRDRGVSVVNHPG